MIRILALLLFPLYLQAQTPAQLLNEIQLRFKNVQDYSADLQMKFDIPFVRIEELSGKVYFKQPDRFRVKSQGIAFLPKQNPYYALATIADSGKYIAVESGSEIVNGVFSRIIQVIPHQHPELVLGKFWIDPKTKTIRRSQLTTKSNGTIQIDYEYGDLIAYALPTTMSFVVETAKFKVPKMVAVDLNSKKKTDSDPLARQYGKIYLRFTNYKINQKLSDQVFLDSSDGSK